MSQKVNILHLSDLHFGYNSDPKANSTAVAQRKNTLDGIFKELKSVDAGWQPDVVAISGDIAWKGSDNNYEEAALWLNELLDLLNLEPEQLIICPGNHDIDRSKTKGFNPPSSAEEADDWLKIEELENPIRPFKAFSSFCEKMKLSSFKIGEKELYLTGVKQAAGIRFLALNSAWYCRGDDDKGKLWLGLPQLEVMESHSQLVNPDKYDIDPVTIALFHHPPGCLHDAEQHSYGNRISTYKYLYQRCHIMLCGHVHSEAVDPPARMGRHAALFTGGASYAGNTYRNNFSILQVDAADRSATSLIFEFDPLERQWNTRIDASYSFRNKELSSGDSAPAAVTPAKVSAGDSIPVPDPSPKVSPVDAHPNGDLVKNITVDILNFMIDRFSNAPDFDNLCRTLGINNI
ncbi:MAG: metallophosphoesterase, partial [bacterium]|nr:metallophosphoesterase [bacterium]